MVNAGQGIRNIKISQVGIYPGDESRKYFYHLVPGYDK